MSRHGLGFVSILFFTFTWTAQAGYHCEALFVQQRSELQRNLRSQLQAKFEKFKKGEGGQIGGLEATAFAKIESTRGLDRLGFWLLLERYHLLVMDRDFYESQTPFTKGEFRQRFIEIEKAFQEIKLLQERSTGLRGLLRHFRWWSEPSLLNEVRGRMSNYSLVKLNSGEVDHIVRLVKLLAGEMNPFRKMPMLISSEEQMAEFATLLLEASSFGEVVQGLELDVALAEQRLGASSQSSQLSMLLEEIQRTFESDELALSPADIRLAQLAHERFFRILNQPSIERLNGIVVSDGEAGAKFFNEVGKGVSTYDQEGAGYAQEGGEELQTELYELLFARTLMNLPETRIIQGFLEDLNVQVYERLASSGPNDWRRFESMNPIDFNALRRVPATRVRLSFGFLSIYAYQQRCWETGRMQLQVISQISEELLSARREEAGLSDDLDLALAVSEGI